MPSAHSNARHLAAFVPGIGTQIVDCAKVRKLIDQHDPFICDDAVSGGLHGEGVAHIVLSVFAV